MLKIIKQPFYRVVKYLINSDYFREQLWFAAKDLFSQHNHLDANNLLLEAVPQKYLSDQKENISTLCKKQPFLYKEIV